MKRHRIREIVPRRVRRRVPKFVRLQAEKLYSLAQELALDYIKWIIRGRGEFTPPRHLFMAASVGGRVIDFTRDGREIFRCNITLANLKPYETILEVGCGIGRNAVPLTKYLSSSGRYEGFDIVRVSVGWCQKGITRKYPNFRFRLADIYNKAYNPNGKLKASEYKFPYSNEFFDFVFLTSVFTHMIPNDVEHYLSEIARVLKTGGRCMITFLLLNPESLRLIDAGLSAYALKYEWGRCRLEDRGLPEAIIAYEEDYVSSLFRALGLEIIEPIRYGGWSGRSHFFSGQDIVLARKTKSTSS